MLRGKELWLAALAAIIISAIYGAVVYLTREIPILRQTCSATRWESSASF